MIHYIALVFITAILWVPGFSGHGTLISGPELITPLYQAAYGLLAMSPTASTILAILIVFASALSLNNILSYHDLTPKNNLLPALIFIVLMSSNPLILNAYPLIIALPLLTWFLHTIYKMNDEPENYMEVFNASILVSIISMIYFPAAILWILIWLALLIYGSFNGRNIIISFIAFLLPYLYLGLYFFWTDRLEEAGFTYLSYFQSVFHFEMNTSMLQWVIWGLFLIFMLLPSFMRISSSLSVFGINYRKKMAVTIWLMVFSLPMIIMSGKLDYHTMIFLPASVMTAHYFHLFKRSVLNELALLLFIILILVHNYYSLAHATLLFLR
jgi:hypothetical protein